MYTLDNRISDLCKLENYITREDGKEVLVSEVELIQIIQKMKKDMEACIGSSGKYMDGKLQEWIKMLEE